MDQRCPQSIFPPADGPSDGPSGGHSPHHWGETPESHSKEERFILAHGCSPWLVSSRAEQLGVGAEKRKSCTIHGTLGAESQDKSWKGRHNLLGCTHSNHLFQPEPSPSSNSAGNPIAQTLFQSLPEYMRLLGNM